MMTGLLIKAIAGFYYVRAEGQVYLCRARGVFKNRGVKPLVGDRVVIEPAEDGTGVVTEVLERRNSFIRPAIANVEKFLLVFSLKNPEVNLSVVDRFLVMAEKNHTDVVICLNKADLSDDGELERVKRIYSDLYPVIYISSVAGVGQEELKEHLKGKICALSGPSGVGKSTMLNTLKGEIVTETGVVSAKTGRGKNTTRHTEIFETDFGADIFDTPGFTSFDVVVESEEELERCFPEIFEIGEACKYDNCRHIKEPDCRVLQALESGEIHKSRYDSYVEQLKELRERNKKW